MASSKQQKITNNVIFVLPTIHAHSTAPRQAMLTGLGAMREKGKTGWEKPEGTQAARPRRCMAMILAWTYPFSSRNGTGLL